MAFLYVFLRNQLLEFVFNRDAARKGFNGYGPLEIEIECMGIARNSSGGFKIFKYIFLAEIFFLI